MGLKIFLLASSMLAFMLLLLPPCAFVDSRPAAEQQQQTAQSGVGTLPPRYLSIAGWKQCVKQVKIHGKEDPKLYYYVSVFLHPQIQII